MHWSTCSVSWTRFPNPSDPSLGSAAVSRRLLSLAALALAALLIGGCSDTTSPMAARVADVTISNADFQAELDEWTGNEAVLDPEAPLAAAPGAYEGGFVRGLLSQRIEFELTRAEFEAQGLKIDDAMREQVITVVFGDQATADQQLEAFSDEYTSAVLDDLARQIGLSTTLGEDGYGVWRTEALASTDIEVNPRYGSWNGGTGTITAPPAPLSGPAGT
jgi:hypothetical protein